MAKYGQHIHARHWFAVQQDSNVVAADFNARGLFHSQGAGLVRCLLQHGGKAEKFAVTGLIDHHFLVIVVNDADLNAT